MRAVVLVFATLMIASPAFSQVPEDDALLDLAGPKLHKMPKAEPKAEAKADLEEPAAPKPAEASAPDARRARREARHAREKIAREAGGKVEASTVEPGDEKKVPSSKREKTAAQQTAVETIASDPATASKVAREAKSEAKPEAKTEAKSEAKPEAQPEQTRAERKRARPTEEKPAKPARKKSAYDIARESWHAPAPPEMCAAHKASEKPDLVFHIQGKNLTYVLKPKTRKGGWDEQQLAIAKEAFGSWDGGPTPHARTLDLVYAATLHFGCPYVTLISGIRKDRGGSRHSHGLAADIVLPGVDDEELAAYFRVQGFVGVGTYPRSGFVHVDTRDQSFFWIDRSKPNQHGRVVQVRKDESDAADAAARARGDAGFVNPPRLAKALHVRAIRKLKAHKAKVERDQAKAAAAPAP